MATFRHFLSRRGLLAIVGVAAVLFGLAVGVLTRLICDGEKRPAVLICDY